MTLLMSACALKECVTCEDWLRSRRRADVSWCRHKGQKLAPEHKTHNKQVSKRRSLELKHPLTAHLLQAGRLHFVGVCLSLVKLALNAAIRRTRQLQVLFSKRGLIARGSTSRKGANAGGRLVDWRWKGF